MKYKTYTFRAYPNKAQQNLIDLTFLMCKLMFNTLLKQINDNYYIFHSEFEHCIKNNITFDSEKFNCTHSIQKISHLKKKDERYSKVDSLALCAEYSNLVRGMQLFYKGKSNKPKYKSRKDKHSYTTSMVNQNIRFKDNKIRLPKIGFVKIRGYKTLPKECKIKRAVVFEDKKGKYFISVIFEIKNEENPKTVPATHTNTVGLDFKIGDIFVSSTNFIPHYTKTYFNLLDKISLVQKNVNRKHKFSKNYWKAINKLRIFHRKIVNIRTDFLNKLSTLLAKKYDYIIIENLSIKEIVLKLGRGKNAYNTSFNTFIKKLLYKVNGKVIKIDKWFPSSKKCSNCGKKKKHLKLSQRIYRCAFCGNIIDRDLNAAINIQNEGLNILNNV